MLNFAVLPAPMFVFALVRFYSHSKYENLRNSQNAVTKMLKYYRKMLVNVTTQHSYNEIIVRKA